MTSTSAPPRRRKLGPGWIPQQHGAWAMLIAPFVLGLVQLLREPGVESYDGPAPLWVVASVLFLLWIVGYFAFYSMGLWLRSHRKEKYLPPVRAYATATAMLGLVLVFLAPQLLIFVPLFLPFLVVGLWLAARREDRSLLSGACTVVAACLMTLVVYGIPLAPEPGALIGLGPTGSIVTPVMTAVLIGYFFGTVLYVKTVIRERENPRYTKASIIYHAVLTFALALLAGFTTAGSWWLVAVFAVLTARAWAVAGRKVRPAVIGVGEIVATLAVVAACLTL